LIPRQGLSNTVWGFHRNMSRKAVKGSSTCVFVSIKNKRGSFLR
jgi:hypothetical protein